jgi:hypothetical protein
MLSVILMFQNYPIIQNECPYRLNDLEGNEAERYLCFRHCHRP